MSETSVKGSQIGVVGSDKRDKTRKVVVEYMARHPKYGKFLRQRTILQVHDAVGDVQDAVVGSGRP